MTPTKEEIEALRFLATYGNGLPLATNTVAAVQSLLAKLETDADTKGET